MSAVGLAKRSTQRVLRGAGLELRRVPDPMGRPRREYLAAVDRVGPMVERRNAQTIEDVRALQSKYAEPIFGTAKVYDLMGQLAFCIDSMDPITGCVSQLVHSLQVVEGMANDGIDDPEMLLAGLIHDIGKLVMLVGEDPANVGGMTRPIGAYEEGIGLDQCVMQWGADEFAYSRLKDHVPDHVAWMIRYHSVHIDDAVPLMDERDARLMRDFGKVLVHYDGRTKSLFKEPKTSLEDYRDLIEEAFPEAIEF